MPNPIAPRHRWHCLAVLPALLFPLFAGASAVDDVTRLMQRGAYGEAMALADTHIARAPQDANMRFLKGVLLVQMERKPDAVEVFTALTRDFPKLAEPYNNLGVLLAGAGEYEKARQALQRAVQLVPGYGIAHENLGDLYAKLSTVAYEKAAQLDAGNVTARTKLNLARNLNNAVANAATTSARPAGAAPATVAADALAVAPAKAAAAAPVAPAQVAAVTPSKAHPVAPGANTTDAAAIHEKAVLESVIRWANAWSARDMRAYLAAYAPDFSPPEGMSLDEWKAERTARIVGKREIKVVVQQPGVVIEGDRATVKFLQSYSSDQFRSTDVKLLVLVRHGKQWLIQKEQVTS